MIGHGKGLEKRTLYVRRDQSKEQREEKTELKGRKRISLCLVTRMSLSSNIPSIGRWGDSYHLLIKETDTVPPHCAKEKRKNDLGEFRDE